MKIPKWQHELARYYKRGKLVSYFLNNAAKTCLYGLKISENIEIGHFFQSRTFFHLSSNLHTSCLSAFKYSHWFFETYNTWSGVHLQLSSWSNIKAGDCKTLSLDLFFIYINNLSGGLTSNTRFFANDVNLFFVVDNINFSNLNVI